MLSDEAMIAKNPSAYAKALDMQARLDAGDLIEGHNCAPCVDGCGRTIIFKDYDIDGADGLQPNGFKCLFCDLWCADECGDREPRICDTCRAFGVAQDFAAIAEEAREAAFRGNFTAVLAALRKGVAIERDLGRRARTLQARANRPSTDSCDPAKCLECRQGAA